MFPTRTAIMFVVICIYYSNASKWNKRGFVVVLENVQECKDPNPPYTKNIKIIPKYKVDVVNGKRYLSGNTTIIQPIQFLNFSGRTSAVDRTGKRVIKFQISKVSCRNVFAKAMLQFSNISFSSKNCMLQTGVFRYDHMDLNKIMHALPGWHASGELVHELQMTTGGATDFCSEIRVNVTD